jgi:hypothetical protein
MNHTWGACRANAYNPDRAKFTEKSNTTADTKVKTSKTIMKVPATDAAAARRGSSSSEENDDDQSFMELSDGTSSQACLSHC